MSENKASCRIFRRERGTLSLSPIVLFVFMAFIFNGLLSGCCSVRAVLPKEIPEEIIKARTSALRINITEETGGSAVRISDDLVLSSAHLVKGFDGKSNFEKAFFLSKGKKYELKVVDQGLFNPDEGKIQDWVILKSAEGAEPLAEYSVAKFPTKSEISEALRKLGKFGEKNLGVPIWSITRPSLALRMFPRPAPDGKNVFLSKGYLKTDNAYKQHIIFIAQTGQIYDELYSPFAPGYETNIEAGWDNLKDNKVVRMIYILYGLYEKDGDSLIYHTADYSNGSSGGGFYMEETGNLIGIVSMGANPESRRAAYYGIGQLYRIDRICQQSKYLSEQKICGELSSP